MRALDLLLTSKSETGCRPCSCAEEALHLAMDIDKTIQSIRWCLEGGAQRGSRKETGPCLPTLAW